MTIQMNGVEVSLGRHSEDWRKTSVVVKVWSVRKPHLKATNEIDPGTVTTAQSLIQLVGTAGGACAEYLGKKYGDNIDPTKAASFAMNAFVEEVKLSKSLGENVPEKLKRLAPQVSRLTNPEQELYERFRWYLARGDALTPKEVSALDKILSRLHSEGL